MNYICHMHPQENGITFPDGPSDQQLLSPGKPSYVDHFWVTEPIENYNVAYYSGTSLIKTPGQPKIKNVSLRSWYNAMIYC